MKMQHLTSGDVDAIVAKCQAIEALHQTTASNTIEKRPGVTDDQVNLAQKNLLNVLNAMSDDAVAELQAMVWIGRGEDDGKDWNLSLNFSRNRLDQTSRSHLAEKSPLGKYIQEGIAKTGAQFV